jgi:hypothetical protein
VVPPAISIPSLTPSRVIDEINLRAVCFEGEAERNFYLLDRIANHAAMQKVWGQLVRKRGSEFFYPVRMNSQELLTTNRGTFEDVSRHLKEIGREGDAARLLAQAPSLRRPRDQHQLQNLAAGYLFAELYDYTNPARRRQVLTNTEFKALSKQYSALFARLNDDSAFLERQGLLKESADLRRVARSCLLLSLPGWGNRIVTQRNGQESLNVRGCVFYFSRVLLDLFHKRSMAGTIANLVEVTLPGTKITRKQVERILRSDRGKSKIDI